MEPFTLQCTSCQSRIRVRNPNMIGQIANCPKCGAMIMIAAPQKILVESNNGSPNDSLAVTREALPPLEEGLFGDLSGLDQQLRPEGNWLRDSSSTANPPPLGLGGEDSNDSSMFAPIGPAEAEQEPQSALAISDLPRRARTTSSSGKSLSSTKSKQILLVGAIGLCSLLIACGVFVLFLKWFSGPNREQGKSDTPAVAQSGTKFLGQNLDSIDPGVDPSDVPNVDPGIGIAIPEPTSVNPPGPAIADPPSLSSPAAMIPSAATPSAVTPSAVTPSDSIAVATPAINPSASLDSTKSDGLEPTGTLPADANSQSIKKSLPPGLQNFANLFDQSIVPFLPDANVALSAAPAGGNDATPTETITSTAALSIDLPVGIDKKLTAMLSALALQGRPLSETINALGLITDIPFTVDLDSLSATGINPVVAVNYISKTSVSVSGVLESISQELQLSFDSIENKFLVVRGTEETLTKRVKSPVAVADLVSDDQQGAALASAVVELLPELSGSLQYRDGGLHTDLEKTDRLLWNQATRLIETWRAKRPAQPLQTEAGLLPDWPMDAVKELAQGKISKVFLPEPLAQSWQRAATEVGLTCWVDWPGLLNAQIQPSKVAMVFTHGRTLEDILQNQADKYSVVFAIEDGRTLWATSPEMHRFQSRLYVLPIAGKTIEEWTAELKPLTPYNFDGTPTLKVIASPDKQFVFVRCCRPLLNRYTP